MNSLLAQLTLTPNPNSTGFFPVDIVVNDLGSVGTGGNLSYTARVVVEVQNVNDAPYFTKTPAPLAVEFPNPLPCPDFQLSPYEYSPYFDGTNPINDDHEAPNFCPVVASFFEDTKFTFPSTAFDFYDVDWDGWQPEFAGVKMSVKHGQLDVSVDSKLNISLPGNSDGKDSWNFYTDKYQYSLVRNAVKTFSYTPEKDWNGDETLVFRARDDEYEISIGVILHVIPVNDAPNVSLMNVPYLASINDYNPSNKTDWMNATENYDYSTRYLILFVR